MNVPLAAFVERRIEFTGEEPKPHQRLPLVFNKLTMKTQSLSLTAERNL